MEKEKLEMEERVKLKEIEAKVQIEKVKLEKNMAHQPPPHNLMPLRILDLCQNLRKMK